MKERQSNMELLRIIAMLLVLLVHANYYSLGLLRSEDVMSNPFSSAFRIFFEQLCIVGVDVFVLISGWFGIKPKIKGGLSILYQIFFYGLLFLLFGLAFGATIPKREMLKLFWFGGYYWFVPAYLGLYAFAPVLNFYVEHASPKTQLGVLILFFFFEFIYGWSSQMGAYHAGYSFISFIGLYLLARFIRLHSHVIRYWSFRKNISIYLGITILSSIFAFLDYKFLGGKIDHIAYCSPFVVSASLFLLLAFAGLSFHSKSVNWVACSVFSIYLVHLHPVIDPIFKTTMRNAYYQMHGGLYIVFCLIAALAIGFVCVLLDKVRLYTWNCIISGSLLDKALDSCHGLVKRICTRVGY